MVGLEPWSRLSKSITTYFIIPSEQLTEATFQTDKRSCSEASNLVLQPRDASFPQRLYITAWPHHGAGVGHQFREWVLGIWAAHQYNITYVYTPFLTNSAFWTSFLGFGVNEVKEEDIKNHHDMVIIKEIRDDVQRNASIDRWILKQRKDHMENASNGTTTIIRFYRMRRIVPNSNPACFSPVTNRLRLKYCARRVSQPVHKDLYSADRSKNRFIVAIHLRCGNSCYDPNRATPLSSIEKSILKLNSDILLHYHDREVVFHIFTQPPLNDTAENHFGPLLSSEKLRIATPHPVSVVAHFYLNAPITLHHLIMSDLLLTAQSDFSYLAGVLRIGITIGAVPGCHSKLSNIAYDKRTGEYSSEKLRSILAYNDYIHSKKYTTNTLKYTSLQECDFYTQSREVWQR